MASDEVNLKELTKAKDDYVYGFSDKEDYKFKSKKGLDAGVVDEISYMKEEPEWMRQFRQRSLQIFEKKSMPTWGGDLSTLDFNNIFYWGISLSWT